MILKKYCEHISNNKFVIVFFYSKDFKELYNLTKKMNDKCIKRNLYNIFLFIDTDNSENKEIIENEFIKSIPLFRIYRNGIVIEEILGNYENIENIIESHL